MNKFFWLIFVYLFKKVILEYESIELIYSDSNYYIPINFPSNISKTYYNILQIFQRVFSLH